MEARWARGEEDDAESLGWEAFDSMAAQAAVLDPDGRIVVVNRSWARLTEERGGRADRCGAGSDYLEVCRRSAARGSSQAAQAAAGIEAVLAGRRPSFELDYLLDDEHWYTLSASALPGGRGAVVTHVDVSRFQRELLRRALHEPLTGLPNRLVFADRLSGALARSAGRAGSVAVLFVDVDRFKLVNDTLGHAAGDQLLVVLAERLRDALRAGDTLARLGGDEFVFLCEDLAGPDEAVRVAERVAAAVHRPTVVGGREVVPTVSIGIAVALEGASPATLLSDADAALHRAKERGRARSVVFDEELRTRATRSLALEGSVRRAVAEGGFRLAYQPQVRVDGGGVVGFEALLRLDDRAQGEVGPDEFVLLAEDAGLIVELGAWAVGQACRQAARWRHRYPGLAAATMSVNLSPGQLARPGFAEVVRRALAETGLPPGALCFELTESALADVDAAGEELDSLRALGVRLAVDDFGTGYSSLGHLRRFAFDEVKVDRSFVDGLDVDPGGSALVAAVVAMARALSLRTVAEGVETPAQLARLRELGCDVAQGHLLGRPQAPEALEAAW